MGGNRRGPGIKPKRKSYKKPTIQKLTPEEAKELLKAKAIPGDPQAEKLLNEIQRFQSQNDKKTPSE
jgi:hypothetical protein